MSSFTDSEGRSWVVKITVGSMLRINDELGLNFSQMCADEAESQKLFMDYAQLARILYCVCKPQAEKSGVSLSEFADALDGESWSNAAAALSEALTLFFQPAEKANPPTTQ